MTKFNEQRLMTILRAPTISEKSTFVADKHEQVIFEVVADATKPEIKAAVELLFLHKTFQIQLVYLPILFWKQSLHFGRRQ